MATAYLDEAGIHDGASHCVVAGLVGKSEAWDEFATEWQDLMTANEQTDFHAVDLLRRRGPYFEWTDTRFEEFLTGVISVLCGSGLRIVGVAIDVEVFARQGEGFRRFATGAEFDPRDGRRRTTGAPSKPFFAALLWCFCQALTATPEDESVDFVCDRQELFEGLARQLFETCSELREPPYVNRMGSIEFSERPATPGLQAADLVAYLTYRYANAAYADGAIPERMDQVIGQLGPIGFEDIRVFDLRAWRLVEATLPAPTRELFEVR